MSVDVYVPHGLLVKYTIFAQFLDANESKSTLVMDR